MSKWLRPIEIKIIRLFIYLVGYISLWIWIFNRRNRKKLLKIGKLIQGDSFTKITKEKK